MLTGYTDNLPKDTLLDSGVLMVSGTVVGVTSGGCKFDPGKTLRNVDYDGKRSDVQGNDRVIGWMPKITATLQELGDAASGGQLAKLEPGSSEATSGSVKTTTPKAAGVLLATGDYLVDLEIVFERAGGGYARLAFPIALCDKWDVAGSDKNEAKISAEFSARLSSADAVASPGKCPYQVILSTHLPS